MTLLGVLLFLTAAVFAPSLQNGFTDWDDDFYIHANPLVTGFAIRDLGSIFLSYPLGNYIPLVILSFALEHSAFGLDPFPYHLTNFLLHLGAAAVVFLLLAAWDGRLGCAAIATALWSLHPTKVEAVAWVSGRKDLLAGLFFLLSLFAALRSTKTRAAADRGASLASYLLACLSKPTAVTLPLVMLLPEFPRGLSALVRKLRSLWPYLAISALCGTAVILARRSYEAMYHEGGYDLWSHAWIFTYRLGFYYPLRLFLPHLRLDYYQSAPGHLLILASAAALAAALLLLIMLARRDSPSARALLFYVVTLAPAMTLFNYGYSGDRFLYLPSLGMAYLVALQVSAALASPRRARQVPIAALLVVVLLALGTSSRRNCGIWRSSVTLWTDAISAYPEEPKSLANRAMAFAYRGRARHSSGDLAGALADLDEALRLQPTLPEALLARSRLYRDRHDLGRAYADVDVLLRREGSSGEALLLRSELHYLRGDLAGARRDALAARRSGREVPERLLEELGIPPGH